MRLAMNTNTSSSSRRRPRSFQKTAPTISSSCVASRTVLLSTFVVFLSVSTCRGFLPMRTPFVVRQAQSHVFRATVSISNDTDTWSRPVLRSNRDAADDDDDDDDRNRNGPRSSSTSNNNNNNNSRFGVRKRVRRVLEKAKIRTGRKNSSSCSAEVVAEAASIGALNERADLVFSPDYKPAQQEQQQRQRQKDSQGYTPTSSPNNSTNTGLVLERTTTPGDTDSSATSGSAAARRTRTKLSSAVNVDALLTGERLVDPLPFKLPKLSAEQEELLAAGERIQEQSKMGREGSGFVVLDVKAPPYVVWECLLDFEAYPEYISTVRSMRMFTNTHLKSSYLAEQPVLPGTGREMRHYGTASISRASFVLSKFKLKIAAVHKYQPHPDGHFMEFTLDRACKNVVLKDAKGIWYTESHPERPDVTRVWLLCEVKVSSMLPSMIVDYVAKRAMPRATNWLRPQVETMRKALMDE